LRYLLNNKFAGLRGRGDKRDDLKNEKAFVFFYVVNAPFPISDGTYTAALQK
jgi:hypothetical protein